MYQPSFRLGTSILIFLLTFPFLGSLSLALDTKDNEDKTKTIPQDSLDSQYVEWGGASEWEYSEVLEITDSLVDSLLGGIVIDRHGEEASCDLLCVSAPFSSPRPNKRVIISLWGSNVDGCFVEVVTQWGQQMEGGIPEVLEVGAGNDTVVKLTANAEASKVWEEIPYKYSVYENEREYTREGIWRMTRTFFPVDQQTAKLLTEAPNEETKARLTYKDGETQLFPIGDGTVKAWEKTFNNYNPNCQPIE